MRLTNDRYLIQLHAGSGIERYYRDGIGWVKQSVRGTRFPATAEQVLNHVLPALAGVKEGASVQVRHRDLDTDTAARLDQLRSAVPVRPRRPRRAP